MEFMEVRDKQKQTANHRIVAMHKVRIVNQRQNIVGTAKFRSLSVCRKTLLGSKDEVLWRVEGTQYPPYIAPPLGEGLGWGQSLGF